MKEDVIRQVKEAESRSEEKVHEAQTQADKVIHEARHRAVESRLEILETARAKAKKIIEAGTKDFEPELEQAHQTFKDDIAKDSVQAQQKIDEVADFVVAKFEERLGKE